MRIAVLFIVVCAFSACAVREPVITVREFNEYKNRMDKSLASHSRRYFQMDDNLIDVYHWYHEDSNKLLQQLSRQLSTVLNGLNASFENSRVRTNKAFHLLLDALARKGIKIDLDKEDKLQQKEATQKKLKEKSK